MWFSLQHNIDQLICDKWVRFSCFLSAGCSKFTKVAIFKKYLRSCVLCNPNLYVPIKTFEIISHTCPWVSLHFCFFGLFSPDNHGAVLIGNQFVKAEKGQSEVCMPLSLRHFNLRGSKCVFWQRPWSTGYRQETGSGGQRVPRGTFTWSHRHHTEPWVLLWK